MSFFLQIRNSKNFVSGRGRNLRRGAVSPDAVPFRNLAAVGRHAAGGIQNANAPNADPAANNQRHAPVYHDHGPYDMTDVARAIAPSILDTYRLLKKISKITSK